MIGGKSIAEFQCALNGDSLTHAGTSPYKALKCDSPIIVY
jgi:hypothetical protein